MRHSTAGLLKVRLVVEFILCFVRVGAGLQQADMPWPAGMKGHTQFGVSCPLVLHHDPMQGLFPTTAPM